jgi:hypothetical protein
MARPERDEEKAVKVLMSELRDGSQKMATALFPQGPVGTSTLSRERELDLVARHWDDPAFRKNLLDRMAPPGPNGYPDPILAQKFVKLYHDAVLSRGGPTQDMPDPKLEAEGQPEPPVPMEGTQGGFTVSVGTGDSGISPISTPPAGVQQEQIPVTPPAGAPPSAAPTAPPAATGEAMLPKLPTGMTPPPVPPEGI